MFPYALILPLKALSVSLLQKKRVSLLAADAPVHSNSTVGVDLVPDYEVSFEVDAASRLDRARDVKWSSKVDLVIALDASRSLELWRSRSRTVVP